MKVIITLLFALNIILLGCNDMKETSNEKIDYGSIQTEIGILPKLISLPRQPVLVKWKIEKNHGNDSVLYVLFKFNENDFKYIKDHSLSFEHKKNETLWTEFYDKWLPEDAKTGIAIKLVGEAYELIGIVGRKANLFANPDLSSYIHGGITPLKNGYISVALETM
jgi:hypothetical protein